jgi:sugar phosphate isomerase/epimerase
VTESRNSEILVHPQIYPVVSSGAVPRNTCRLALTPAAKPELDTDFTIVATLKIGIQTRTLRQPLRRAIATAAELGADGVEIDARRELPPGELSQTGLRQFRKLLADHRLGVSAVSFLTRRGYDDSDKLERRVLATHAAMKFAQALGSNVVINRVSRTPEQTDDPRLATLVGVLSELGAFGDRVGARLALQTGDDDGPRLANLLALVPDQTVGVDFHPSGLIHQGHDVGEAVAALGRHVLHLHACDAVRDLSRGQVLDVELGRGAADLPAVVGQLAEFNYRGWITIECPQASDPVAEAAAAVEFLRSL